MPEKRTLLILANSKKKSARCIAGKFLTARTDGMYDVGPWVRPISPIAKEGEIPTSMTVFNGISLQPFDMVEITVDRHAGDPNHPEDWLIERDVQWQMTGKIADTYLPNLYEQPTDLWGHNSSHSRSVPFGYVQQMTTPSTLTLIQPTTASVVRVVRENWPEGVKTKIRLHLRYAGIDHNFSVTDIEFIARHRIYDRAAREGDFSIPFSDPSKVAFCLSLTPPHPQPNGPHYKIAATIFELP